MGVRGFLRTAGIGPQERRKSERVRCRLHCTIRARRRIRARVLDVSEGGLCILSPVALPLKRPVVIEIEVPPRGGVEIEAAAWNVRRVRGSGSSRNAWSIGMMISKADDAFWTLLPGGSRDAEVLSGEVLASKLSELAAEASPEEELGLEEDSLSAAELDALDVELLSVAELAGLDRSPAGEKCESIAAQGSLPEDTLRLFRVRVKARTGPRTRTLTVGAVSEVEAMRVAESELEDAWELLEVQPA